MNSYYNSPLVILSVIVAIFASYFALSLANTITKLSPSASRWWIAGGATIMGVGVWAMHFIGMLALRLPIPIGYDLGLTIVSLVIPIAVSALALWQCSQSHLPNYSLVASASLMGLGITVMHYTGMAAMKMQPEITYDPDLFLASMVIAVTASGAALWMSFRLRQFTQFDWLIRLAAALVMGLAIVGMHYTGMAAAYFSPGSICRAATTGFDQDSLAEADIVATVGILILAMMASLFKAELETKSKIVEIQQSNLSERQKLINREQAAWEIAEDFSSKHDRLLKISEDRKHLYEAILNTTPDFMYVFEFGEKNHYFAYANDELLKLFGRTYEDTIGKTFIDLGYEPWHAEMHNKEIDTVRDTKLPLRGEVSFNGTFGKRMYDYIFVPVFDERGEVKCVAGTTRDVTDYYDVREKLKNNEIILMQNEKTLKEADLRKDDFLAMLAHELRNPMAPISAAAKIMTMSKYNEDRVQKSSEIILRQVKHMVGIVDDLLDVSRVNRGLVKIDNSPQDLYAVIADSVEQVRPLIDSKQQSLTLQLDSGSIMILGDFKRLVQVFTNLLNNAAKYTQNEGELVLGVTTSNNEVKITFLDNGIGIIPEDQEAIFDLFTQAKRSTDRSEGGLGLGLALVKTLVELHDGSINCSSDGLGKGSKFTITFPIMRKQKTS